MLLYHSPLQRRDSGTLTDKADNFRLQFSTSFQEHHGMVALYKFIRLMLFAGRPGK